MPFTNDDVPPGPYFHGTRRALDDGSALQAGTVDPSAGDTREMVWATTDPDAALTWAQRGPKHSDDIYYVYEVDLIDPEVDTNHHRDWETGPFISVMAPTGTVKRLVQSIRASD